MSPSLTEPQDVGQLAARGARLEQSVSVGQLPRLVEALPAGAGNQGLKVACRLDFDRDAGGHVVIDAVIATRWTLECQRCLEGLEEDVDIAVTWRSGELPDGDFEADAGPVRLVEWVEDELLLHLPAVPVHAQLEHCADWARRHLRPADEPAPVRTPFAGLKDLLNGQD